MENMFLQILKMGVTAGYCILVVIVLRLCMKRMPKVYSYALWSVVYFRLVCPVSVSSVFSLLKIRPKTLPEKIGAQASVHVGGGIVEGNPVGGTTATILPQTLADTAAKESKGSSVSIEIIGFLRQSAGCEDRRLCNR